jgi:hypothetical protein
MKRTLLTLGLVLLAVNSGPAADPPPPKPARPAADDRSRAVLDALLQPQLLDPDRFPPEMLPLVGLSNKHVLAANRLDRARQAIQNKYNNGRYVDDRWGWLAAKRVLVRDTDRAAREVVELEWSFWTEYDACDAAQKDWIKERGKDMAAFPERRLKCREDWYYTATMHCWRWEVRGKRCLNYRLYLSVCKTFGCESHQLNRFLAHVDLLATDLLPAHMSQWLTIPMSVMSGPPPK